MNTMQINSFTFFFWHLQELNNQYNILSLFSENGSQSSFLPIFKGCDLYVNCEVPKGVSFS